MDFTYHLTFKFFFIYLSRLYLIYTHIFCWFGISYLISGGFCQHHVDNYVDYCGKINNE
jgi:hypothetical protein